MKIKILNIKEEVKAHYWLDTWSEPYAFYVGRAIETNLKVRDTENNSVEVKISCEKSPLANPYRVNKESERDKKIEQYKAWLEGKLSDPMSDESEYLDKAVSYLLKHRELNLACWCSPKRCHGEVIASYIVQRVQEYYSLEGATTPPEVAIEYVPSQTTTKRASRRLELPWSESELEVLSRQCANCEKCELYMNRTYSVWSRGNGKRRLMVVGEAPGENEDRLGLPFIGDSGKMLEVMLKSVGLDSQEDCWVVNAVKCRPPENRDPSSKEVDSCFNYLQAQITVLRPKVILALGKISTRRLLGLGDFKITVCRGKQYPLDLSKWKLGDSEREQELIEYLKSVIVVPTFHPAYLLRNPEKEIASVKWLSWQDMIIVKSLLE